MGKEIFYIDDWGHYVLEMREAFNLTQQDLANKLGVASATVSRWERGLAIPRAHVQLELRQIFGEETKGGQHSIFLPEIYDPTIPHPLILEMGLVGREEFLRALPLMLRTHSGSFSLWGMYGVGKTLLAAALANNPTLWKHFSAGMLWAGLGRHPRCIDILSRWGTLLELTGAERSRLTTIYEWQQAITQAIGLKRMLVIIDDVWSVEDAFSLHCGGMNCVYVLTTRSQEVAHAFARSKEHVFPVEELSEQDSLKLLKVLSPELVEGQNDQGEIKTLVRLVGGLPLALTIMGRYLHQQGASGQPRRIRTAIEQLKQAESRLQIAMLLPPAERPANLAGEVPLSLYTAIEVSDHHLTPKTRNALYALSVFPAKPHNFSEQAALEVCEIKEREIDALVDCGLLEVPDYERYTMHQTIVDYAKLHYEDGELSNYVKKTEERMVLYFISFIEKHVMDHDLLEREISNIVEAFNLAIQRDMLPLLMRGIDALVPCLEEKGIYVVIEPCCQKIRERAATLNDLNLLAKACFYLGRIAQIRQVLREAEQYYEEGIEIARQIGDRRTVAAYQTHWGEVIVYKGGHIQAEKHVHEALEITRELGSDPRKMGLLLRLLGEIESSRGHTSAAITLFKQALSLIRQVEDYEITSTILQNLGVCVGSTGDYEDSEKYLKEGKMYAEKIGHKQRISAILMNLGMLAFQRQDYKKAEKLYRESLDVIQHIQVPIRVSSVLQNLGMLERVRGNYAQAAIYLQESLDIAYRIEHTWLISETLYEWGMLYLVQGKLTESAIAFEKALQAAQEIQAKELIAFAEYGLARVSEALGDSIESQQWGQKSLDHFRGTDNEAIKLVEAWLQKQMSDNRSEKGDRYNEI